jgi:hypothetical protein
MRERRQIGTARESYVTPEGGDDRPRRFAGADQVSAAGMGKTVLIEGAAAARIPF